TLLNEAGIKDESTLRMLGAKMCWLKLRQVNPALTVKILYALEGAIGGIHEAALPAIRRQELVEWVSSLTPEPVY
ncbi:TfoX/Sxy family protein, partial [Citrobacter sp. TBCS-14]